MERLGAFYARQAPSPWLLRSSRSWPRVTSEPGTPPHSCRSSAGTIPGVPAVLAVWWARTAPPNACPFRSRRSRSSSCACGSVSLPGAMCAEGGFCEERSWARRRAGSVRPGCTPRKRCEGCRPSLRIAEISALGVRCGEFVHGHEAADPHRFNEELLRGRKVSHIPGSLKTRWSQNWLCHVWTLMIIVSTESAQRLPSPGRRVVELSIENLRSRLR
jgi:hypothetical protein